MSIYGIMAIGMTMVIITGGIDISVGSIFALSQLSAGLALQKLGPDAPWHVTMLTAVLVPPSISLAISVLEAVLAARAGVRCISVAYPQGGHLVQDVAALRAIPLLADRYLPAGVRVHAVLHEFMGVFPRIRGNAEDLIFYGALVARLGGASKLITKTYQEAYGIPETQAKDIALGQVAEVDTRNGVIPGRVSRIDPAAVNGTVTVDVRLEGELPAGARPDLSVDGTIEIERLSDVMYVGRPVFGQPNTTVTLFRVDTDGREALRVPVKFGRASVNAIEIVEGLKVGDTVLLSDMSAWDAHNRIRLD